MSERLRSCLGNPKGAARAGSSPAVAEVLYIEVHYRAPLAQLVDFFSYCFSYFTKAATDINFDMSFLT